MDTYLGADIGGTELKLGLLDTQGNILRQENVSVAFDGYHTPILTSVTTAVTDFLRRLDTAPKGIGVSSTGAIDRESGTIIGSWLPGWEGSRVVDTLQAATGLPVTIENDGSCMCLGERWIGAGAGHRDLLCLTIGTGIGASAILNGQLLSGTHGMGMEAGHMVTHRGGIPCTCGRQGCWERYASTSALVQQAQSAGLAVDNGKEILSLVTAGDSTAMAVYDHWLDELAEGIRDLIFLFDPGCILIGGGIAAAGDALFVPLREKLTRGLLQAHYGGFELKPAALGNTAGMIGAVWDHLQRGCA